MGTPPHSHHSETEQRRGDLGSHSKLCNGCGSALNAAHHCIKGMFLLLTGPFVKGPVQHTAKHQWLPVTRTLSFSFKEDRSPYVPSCMQKKSEIMHNGKILIYVFQPPVEDCIQYSSLPFAQLGQRRAMQIDHGKPLL